MKTIALVWVALAALTTVSFLFAAGSGRLGAPQAVLALAAAKAALVAWHFMALRAAHPVWRAALGLLVLGALAAIGGLAGGG